ncbi:PRC-barrel domain-containing protein [Devosia aurantiaca]|uniref:PRC-barrel domain-containing protein n=1 Tax=Devosia aurantiaca TaxID=2714858 RepID=UPI001F3FF8EA|nr:PRC-barrel domain-containing protein [Devosia aurantiaca]
MKDHANHVRLKPSELSSKTLEGAPIYDAHNAEIGKVSHLHGSGPSAEVIVDVGGFLGLGAKPVAVSMAQLDFMRDENGHIHALSRFSKQDLEHMPEHSHHHH